MGGHGDFTNEEKLLLTHGMAHYTGCLICQALLNKFGARAVIFPHLFLFNKMNRFPVVRTCPNLMRMPVAKRIQLVEKSPGEVKICKKCTPHARILAFIAYFVLVLTAFER